MCEEIKQAFVDQIQSGPNVTHPIKQPQMNRSILIASYYTLSHKNKTPKLLSIYHSV